MKPASVLPFLSARLSNFALLLFTIVAANAQTSTSQFASGLTAPQGAVILTGTAISPSTGQLVRHFWSADANGLCRLDPDLGTPGPHSITPATCLRTVVGGVNFRPGQLTFDPARNDIYAVDVQGKSLGIFRVHFLPGGDAGQGLVDPVQQELLGGAGRAVDSCNIGSNVPATAVLGPDSNLYVGFKKTGNIMRILAPQTEPLPCSNVQTNIGATLNQTGDSGLAWIGHDMFGADSVVPVLFSNADQCFSPVNGFVPCKSSNVFVLPPPDGIVSDQLYPALNGNNLYINSANTIIQIANVPSVPAILRNYGGLNFQFLSALLADMTSPVNEVLYVGDDPSDGRIPGQGRWFQVSNAPPAPTPPGVPAGVIATAGASEATVSWTPAQDGQPVTSYTVHNSFASNGIAVPDVIVNLLPGTTIVPTTVIVGGLTNGISYQFEVLASNNLGPSATFSAPSNTVTPQAATIPGAPTGVVASASNASALIAWTPPISNGGSAIISYTVTALSGGATVGITTTVAGSASGAIVSGLTNGTAYTFTVHATNAVGNSPESASSNPVTPFVPPSPPDMDITMTGPAVVNFGANATYTLMATNNGPTSAPQVFVTDVIPATGAGFVSSVATQGLCVLSGSILTCSIGTLSAGTSATITVTLTLSAQATTESGK